MADEDKLTPPATDPPAKDTAPAKDEVKVDPVEFGKLQKTVEELETYKKKTDPVLETLASDPELLKHATDIHNKRLGITPPEDKKDPEKKDDKDTPSPQSPVRDQEVRTSMINDKISDFETKVGIDKLPDDKQQEIRGLIGNTIHEMVDPLGNKTLGQVLNDIPLPALNKYLDKAFKLVNRDSDMKQAEEKGKSTVLAGYEEEVGVMGSIPGGSAAGDEVTLTLKERETIKKAGWDEKRYIANKKAINQIRASE